MQSRRAGNGLRSSPTRPATGSGTRTDWVKRILLLGAVDPNHLVGPGVGAENWVGVQEGLPFKVEFENDPKKANAAAQDVVISTQLDPDLDWATFEFGSIQFGSTVVPVPAGLQSFAASVPAVNVDGTPLRVDISATLDRDAGLVTWTFLSLDPVTELWPENPVAGFLPVNDATHRGEGFVTYNVRAGPTARPGRTSSPTPASSSTRTRPSPPTSSTTRSMPASPRPR